MDDWYSYSIIGEFLGTILLISGIFLYRKFKKWRTLWILKKRMRKGDKWAEKYYHMIKNQK